MVNLKISFWAFAFYCCFSNFRLCAQNIGVFTSVIPQSQNERFVFPPTHDFQLLAQFGDTLADGSTLNTHPDFTAFVPKNERNDIGFLSLNHEIPGLLGGVTVFDLEFDKINQIWKIENGLPVDFWKAGGINRPCSGGVTPWGTVISGEEAILSSDLDSNGYYDSGWLVETRAADRQFVQKIWKAGNAAHENCVVAADLKTVYWGADDLNRGYIFKYVADQKKKLATGKLFVLVREDTTSTMATWIQVPNQTIDQCNNINAFCQQAGAWNFSGIEDVEIGPYGKIFFSTKYSGRIWQFKDKGPVVSGLSVFVENTLYPIQTAEGIKWTKWGIGADNLAFDNADNLWVLQDGDNNHIWMVKPNHTTANPKIYLFASTPFGCEPTGITFTPNKRFMFLSFQHPSASNNDTVQDVTGKRVVFDRGTTVVVARKEFLGMSINDCHKPEPAQPLTGIRFRVSPNPTSSGNITLYSEAFFTGMQVKIAIFDSKGTICQSFDKQADENQICIDFRAKVKGIYTIGIRAEGNTGQSTFIVE
jgi:secreted PhoX family phosphatase